MSSAEAALEADEELEDEDDEILWAKGVHPSPAQHSVQRERVRRPATAHAATLAFMRRTLDVSGHAWWISRLGRAPGGGHGEDGTKGCKVLSPGRFAHRAEAPARASASVSLGGGDGSAMNAWATARERLSEQGIQHSNALPIDPLRTARAGTGQGGMHTRPSTNAAAGVPEAGESPKRQPPSLLGRSQSGGDDWSTMGSALGKTPRAASAALQGAKVSVNGGRVGGGGGRQSVRAPRYAQYYSDKDRIPLISRASMHEVGTLVNSYGTKRPLANRPSKQGTQNLCFSHDLGNDAARRIAENPSSSRLVMSPENFARAPMTPIYIEKGRTAEWTSDSTLHPLILSRRLHEGSATPRDHMRNGRPKSAKKLRAASHASYKATLRQLHANESVPQVRSFFLDGLDSEVSDEDDSEQGTPELTQTKVPDPAGAGKGLVQANDDRCRRGVKVKVAFSFSMEEWARPVIGKVGVLIERSPVVSGTWRVKFPGIADLVECSVGLMGRYHLVYHDQERVEEDLLESA